MKVIEVKDLSKKYNSKTILDNISFSIKQGSICGFIGPNGAGKTTTMNIMAGFLTKNNGNIKVLNQTVTYGNPSTGIRFTHDVPDFYNFLSILEYLNLIKELNKLSDSDVTKILALIGLTDAKNKRINSLSRGMKQRLSIGAAILPKPEVLLCDEPISALDPIGRKDIFDIFKKLKGEMTIFFSTHILEDVEKICDQIILIHQGQIILDDTLTNIKKNSLVSYLEVIFKNKADIDLFIEKFEPLDINKNTVKLSKDKMQEVMKWCSKHNITPIKIAIERPTLESVFIKEVGHE